jgi:hypothetical protein
MRRFIPIALVVLASCTRPSMPPAQEFAARELAGRVPGPPQTCVSTFPNQNLRVIDATTLAYGYARTIYVNRLAGPCPALSAFNTVQVEAQVGSEYCRGDHVRGIEPGAVIGGPWCNLGDWTPYRMR